MCYGGIYHNKSNRQHPRKTDIVRQSDIQSQQQACVRDRACTQQSFTGAHLCPVLYQDVGTVRELGLALPSQSHTLLQDLPKSTPNSDGRMEVDPLKISWAIFPCQSVTAESHSYLAGLFGGLGLMLHGVFIGKK